MTPPDGKLLVGGAFLAVDGIARLNADGFVDTAFNAMIGGGISTVAGVARPGLAQLLPDGTLDTSFVPASTGAGKRWRCKPMGNSSSAVAVFSSTECCTTASCG